MKSMEQLLDNLVENSKSAMIAAIEVHNKPVFPYRYEITTVLVINAWELILKAFILTNYPDVKIIREDGTTKPFEECLRFVSGELGNDFTVIDESISKIYEYRCNCIHFYADDLEVIIFSLLRPNIIFYAEFLNDNFGVDIADETNLILLPIGFRKPISPIDYITNKSIVEDSSPAIQTFIKSIVNSSQRLIDSGIDDSILVDYRMSVINEKRIKNADIIAGITKDRREATIRVENILGNINITDDENAKKIMIDEENLFKKIYTETYRDVVKYGNEKIEGFKKNKEFNGVMKTFKGNPNYHRKRYLDFINQKGGSKDYYSKLLYEQLEKYYKNKKTVLNKA
ncbi:MAG: hypothetical protein O6499_07675 [Candidatus Dadabacteria bacterium]|nr:hypothetical protein [Bacteroidota bacterium]MCZ6469516.1 hypothetical protein [Candidatus Dadabacteria bacterium]